MSYMGIFLEKNAAAAIRTQKHICLHKLPPPPFIVFITLFWIFLRLLENVLPKNLLFFISIDFKILEHGLRALLVDYQQTLPPPLKTATLS